jgi:hypothetical protein
MSTGASVPPVCFTMSVNAGKNMSEMPPMPKLIHSIAVCSLNLVVARHNQAGHDISNSNGYVNSDGGYHFTSREIEIGLLEVND